MPARPSPKYVSCPFFPPPMHPRSNAPSGPATITYGCGGGAPPHPAIRAGRCPRVPPGGASGPEA